jgi:hypothetical protein
MANTRLYRGSVRIGLAFPEAFANWQTPTSAELNATNGLVFDLTCALAEGGTKFDLGDSDSDNTLTFCSVAGETNYTFYNPDIAFEFNRSSDPTASKPGQHRVRSPGLPRHRVFRLDADREGERRPLRRR